MNKVITYGAALVISTMMFVSACTLSLKGITINPEVKTYNVEGFRNTAGNAPSDIHIRFSEALRKKVRDETRLVQKEVDADIIFEGAVSDYNITAEAASGESGSAFNKLKIIIKVQMTDNIDENNNWSQSFSFFKDFPTDQSIQEVEDAYITEIFTQITEDIFNKAFTNW